MWLGDDEDEAALRHVLSNFFADHCGPDVVRRAETLGHSPEVWGRLIQLGAPGMSAPAEAGGGGARGVDLAVAAEECGRAAAPVALVEHLVAVEVLAGCAARDYADAIDGETIASVALRPARDGKWSSVAAGADAGIVVGRRGADVVAQRTEPSGRSMQNTASQGLADVPVTDAAVVLGNETMWDDLTDRWRLLTASALVGAAEAALALGVDYVLSRKQFGVPIGSFQAIQHGLADLPGMIDGARLLVGKAVWAHAIDEPGVTDVEMNDITDPRALASMAFLFAAETASHVTDRVLHFHGGYGCAEEYDIQLLYRRARGWPLALGPRHHELRHLADLLVGR